MYLSGLNTSLYIARKLALNEKKSFSRFIIRIAIIAVTLSIAVMIIGSAITRGYQEVIQNKFYDCWGHIHITNFLADPSNMNHIETIQYDSNLVREIATLPEVKSIEAYTIQSSIIKTNQDIEGLLLKGISLSENKFSLQDYLIQGTKINYSDSNYSKDLLISENTARKLHISVGDFAIAYFIMGNETQPKARKLNIVGIYKTGLEDYDNLFAVCDSRLINHINQRSETDIHGYEIYLKDKEKRAELETLIFNQYIKPPLQTYLIDKRFENIFSWLGMMKMNEQIIIIIMLIIAIINMITALLILVMERTQMIGVLKSIGMENFKIQTVFIYSSIYILSIGLLLGTLIGIGLSLLQKKFGFIQLNEQTYYIKSVPIYLDFSMILFINVIALLVCTLLLMIPSIIIRTISPTKALRFN